MAEVFVSPGVYTQEIDETFVPAGAGAIGAALIGLTNKGIAFRPVNVNNFGEFREKFGGLSTDKYMPYAAKSYLRNGTGLKVVRVLGRGTKSQGNVGLIAFPDASGQRSVSAVSGSNTVLAVVRRRTTGTGDILVSGTPTNFSLSADGEVITGLSLTESAGNYIKKVLGTDPEESKSGEQMTSLYVDAVFDYKVSAVAGTLSGELASFTYSSATADGDAFEELTGGFSSAETPFVVSQNYSGSVYELFKFYTQAHGVSENTNVKVSITQVAYDDSASSFPAFTVVVRRFNDTDREPIIYETFTNCNLDPSSKQYIARVIGDRRAVYDLSQDPPEILYDGDYPNKSNFIRVEIGSGFPSSARPAGFKGVPRISATLGNFGGQGTEPPALPTKLNHLNDRSALDSGVFAGINFDNPGVADRLKITTTSASGASSADDGVLMFANSSDYSGSTNTTAFTRVDILGSNSGNFSTTNKVRFTVPFYGGSDGFDVRVNKLTAQNATNTDTLSGDFNIAIKTLANADEVDFNLLAIPGSHSSGGGNIPDRAIEMVERRADAFFLLDIADATTTGAGLALSVANAITEAEKYDSNYAATYFPWTRINDVDNDRLVWVPPSVEMMGVYAFNDRVSQPWFAPAGFNRGGLDNVLEVRRRLTQSQRDDLYTDNVNPIATFPGQGIVVFGQKTLQKKASVLDRVNVRRMLIEVRKTIAGLSRLFLFEPNTVSVRERLLTQVNSYLSTVQSAQGLTEFRAVLDETTTTPDLIDRNVMKGKIYLKPTNAAEVILFDFAITPQGATFSE
tara:strand:- start:109 stop:2490 length:2382 start_codon:yes stop_codon:yes gene_type:complete